MTNYCIKRRFRVFVNSINAKMHDYEGKKHEFAIYSNTNSNNF